MRLLYTLFAAAATLLGASFALTASSSQRSGGNDYEINWHTIDAGGGILTNVQGYLLNGTVGQPDAGPALTNSGYALRGGFWAAGTPAQSGSNATLDDLTVVHGTLLDGDIQKLQQSDDDYVIVLSQFGFSATEPNIVRIVIGATSPLASPSFMRCSIESFLNNPGGSATVLLYDWSEGQFEQVHQYAIGQTELVEVIDDIPASTLVETGTNRIELQIRHSVVATFGADGFRSYFDWVEMRLWP